jgi:hypothetical protein
MAIPKSQDGHGEWLEGGRGGGDGRRQKSVMPGENVTSG